MSKLSTTACTKLLNNLLDYFEIDDLRTICLNLGVDHERISGENKDKLARGLIVSFDNVGRIPELVAECKKKRPNADWEGIVELDVVSTTEATTSNYTTTNLSERITSEAGAAVQSTSPAPDQGAAKDDSITSVANKKSEKDQGFLAHFGEEVRRLTQKTGTRIVAVFIVVSLLVGQIVNWGAFIEMLQRIGKTPVVSITTVPTNNGVNGTSTSTFLTGVPTQPLLITSIPTVVEKATDLPAHQFLTETPISTATEFPTPHSTNTPTSLPTSTATPSSTSTSTPTPEPTRTATSTLKPTIARTLTPTATLTISETKALARLLTRTPTRFKPTATKTIVVVAPTGTSTPQATSTQSVQPTIHIAPTSLIVTEPPKPIVTEPPKPIVTEPPKPIATEPPKPIATEPPKPESAELTKPAI